MDAIKNSTKFIRNFFVPTAQNGMLPHGLSRTAFLFYLLFALTLVVSSAQLRVSGLATPVDILSFTAEEVTELLNASRDTLALRPLKSNESLVHAAERKARDMFNQQYFAHVTPDGRQPWFFIKEENYVYAAAGENLAIDFLTPKIAHKAFMQSPTHRANIMNPIYEEVGIAVLPGMFDGRSSIIVVQFFGTPKNSKALAAIKETSILLPVEEAPIEVSVPQLPEPRESQPPAEVAGAQEVNSGLILPNPEDAVTLLGAQSYIDSDMQAAMSSVSIQSEVRVISLIIFLLLLIPTVFSIMRSPVHARIYVRPVIIAALFIYIGWFGGLLPIPVPDITSISAQIGL